MILVILTGRFEEPVVYEFPSDNIDITKSDDDVLDHVFRECNHVNGNEWIDGKELRSLSVGDMVEINGTLYVCCNVGWKRLRELVKPV